MAEAEPQSEPQSSEAPALRLVIRSRTHGVEVLATPSGRDETTGLAAVPLPDDDTRDALTARTLLAVAPNGSAIAANGGGKPIAIVDGSAFQPHCTTEGNLTKTLPPDTSPIERLAFSPLGTYLVTWQRADTMKFPDGSLRVWRCIDGSLRKSFHCKILKKTGIQGTLFWSGDERVAFYCVTNTVQIFAGGHSDDMPLLSSIRCEDVACISISPATEPPYGLAAFVPELKGRPASVKMHQYPLNSNNKSDDDKPEICAKSFFRAQDVSIKWSSKGVGILAQTHTDVDATGGSYYGGTGLYLLSATKDYECLVPLPKEGPVADAKWEPSRGKEFIVIAGSVPAVAALYDHDARQLYNFGAAHRNVISWAPHGRFVALCGFGNLAGDVDFWDVVKNKKKKLNSINIPCAVNFGWSPDSRYFMSSTLAPRMNVDNCVRVYRYDGTGPVAVKEDRAPLFECEWLNYDPSLFPDRGPSPAGKERLKLKAAASSSLSGGSSSLAGATSSASPGTTTPTLGKPAAYVPPGARGRGSALAAQIRAEREGQLGGTGKAKVVGGVPGAAAHQNKTVPGLAPPTESRNKKRKEAQRKRKEAAEASAALSQAEEGLTTSSGGGDGGETQETAPPPAKSTTNGDEEPLLTKEDLLKKQKGLKKKLKAVAELQAKVDAGLAPSADQREKLDRARSLETELAEIETKLATVLS